MRPNSKLLCFKDFHENDPEIWRSRIWGIISVHISFQLMKNRRINITPKRNFMCPSNMFFCKIHKNWASLQKSSLHFKIFLKSCRILKIIENFSFLTLGYRFFWIQMRRLILMLQKLLKTKHKKNQECSLFRASSETRMPHCRSIVVIKLFSSMKSHRKVGIATTHIKR